MVTAAAIGGSVATAGKENDENDDYPKAAIVVTVTKAHIYTLSPHLKFIPVPASVRSAAGSGYF